jgi:hypothetical protein
MDKGFPSSVGVQFEFLRLVVALAWCWCSHQMLGVCSSVVAWAGFGWLHEVVVQKLPEKVQSGSCRPVVAAPMGIVFFLRAPFWSLLQLLVALGQAFSVKDYTRLGWATSVVLASLFSFEMSPWRSCPLSCRLVGWTIQHCGWLAS